MSKFFKTCAICVTGFALSSALASASVNHTPAQRVDMACPTQWKNLDVVIDPKHLSWSNSTDKNAFLAYQKAYRMDITKTPGAMNDQYANDALTVASECALRKNLAVDNYFNKVIDTETALLKRINILPFIMPLLFD